MNSIFVRSYPKYNQKEVGGVLTVKNSEVQTIIYNYCFHFSRKMSISRVSTPSGPAHID